jgi:hypothetical protein
MMKDNSSSSSWGGIENEDAVLKVNTCDQSMRIKSFMFCTMDCVAQKIGVVKLNVHYSADQNIYLIFFTD